MNIEDFRTYCLSFKGAYEKMPFEKATSAYDRNLLVFCVAEKWFCFVNVRHSISAISNALPTGSWICRSVTKE